MSLLQYVLAMCLFFTPLLGNAGDRYDTYKQAPEGWQKTFPTEKQAINKDINQIKQNALHFLLANDKQQYRVKKAYVKQLKQHFLKVYYSPWDHPYQFFTKKDILNIEKQLIQQYFAHPGWSENRYPHSKAWVHAIKQNMNLVAFPNDVHAGIAVVSTNLRLLPTNKPSFENRRIAGQGFPFDNLQNSMLRANAPIHILHISNDGMWYLVSTANQTVGWVKVRNIAIASKPFQQAWRSHQYITPIKDQAPVRYRLNSRRAYFLTRMGEIYPLISEGKNDYRIYVAGQNSEGYARLEKARILKNISRPWPLHPTSHAIAHLANAFLGIPYGWGNLYGYRDCSTTMRDLFAAFGIWMPRNSTAQAKSFPGINLQGMTASQKMTAIEKYGAPYFSLIWLHGHITLYVGNKGVGNNKRPYILHSPWGLHTSSLFFGKSGRVVIGRTVITPINLGQGYLNVKKTWLDKADKLLFLVPSSQFESR